MEDLKKERGTELGRSGRGGGPSKPEENQNAHEAGGGKGKGENATGTKAAARNSLLKTSIGAVTQCRGQGQSSKDGGRVPRAKSSSNERSNFER